MTRIICYIVQEKYDRAYMLAEMMSYYAERNDRNHIRMELGIMIAVIRSRTKREWKTDFISVLEEICGYGFVPIISEYAGAAYKLLDECSGDIGKNKKISKKWFDKVVEESGRLSRRYPMYMKTKMSAAVLQPSDIRILECLADGLSIQKTAEKLGINFETLRSKIKDLYRRLGAQNKVDAIMIARESGVI